MARRKFTREELLILQRYAGMGATWKQMAHLLEISPSCFANYMREIPEFKEAVDRGAANSCMHVMETAYTMATSGKEPAMTIFWLKTRCQWREVKEPLKEDQESTDKIKSMPTSELIKLVKDKVG